MHLPKRWWIALPILAGLAYLANDSLTPQLEAALRARVAARLNETPRTIDNPRIAVVGRDITVGGVALSAEEKHRVFALLGSEAGARVLNDATEPLGVASPFALKIERRGARVAISGNMPVSEWREKLRADLLAMGFEVQDSAGFAQGAPANFADIVGFAVKRLAELDPADATVSDATLSLSGEARSSEDYERAVALKTAPVGPDALKAALSPPRVSPYVFSATLNGGVIALSGHLPTDELRRKVVALAAQSGAGAAVSDATQLGAGAPAGEYGAALSFAVSELAKLSQGKATVIDGKVIFEGQGRDNVQASTLQQDARAGLPQGFELAKLDVSSGPVSPYLFGAERRADEVRLTGYAPDEQTRARLVEAARKRFFDVAVIDGLTVAKGAPIGFVDAASHSLGALARLAEGRLSVNGVSVTVSGAARHEAARREIPLTLAEGLPANFHSESLISARTIGSTLDAGQCRAALDALLARSTIRFSADDASVAPESAPFVDAIASTALRCRSATIEVGAYSDGVGIAELNVARGKRRAQAVVDALTRAGADPFRLRAIGHGGERPIAANDANEDRARANRVEFVVK